MILSQCMKPYLKPYPGKGPLFMKAHISHWMLCQNYERTSYLQTTDQVKPASVSNWHTFYSLNIPVIAPSPFLWQLWCAPDLP